MFGNTPSHHVHDVYDTYIRRPLHGDDGAAPTTNKPSTPQNIGEDWNDGYFEDEVWVFFQDLVGCKLEIYVFFKLLLSRYMVN